MDDASTDATVALLGKANANVVCLDRHAGKAAALQRGFRYALAKNYDAVITIDSDLQHAHSVLPNFLQKFEDGAELVLGRRAFARGKMPRMRILSNWLSSGLVSRLAKRHVADSQCGFRLIGKNYMNTEAKAAGFQYETEFLVRALWRGASYAEVDIPTIYNGAKSSMKYLSDTVKFSLLFMRLFALKLLRKHDSEK